jgi:hypothetical protein
LVEWVGLTGTILIVAALYQLTGLVMLVIPALRMMERPPIPAQSS